MQYFPGFVTDAMPHESVCSKVCVKERGGMSFGDFNHNNWTSIITYSFLHLDIHVHGVDAFSINFYGLNF